MVRVLTFTALIALALSGCAASGNSVPVRGDDSERALLAGEWRGDFEGPDGADRHGKISFDFEMGRHTAEGEVVMFAPKKGEKPLALRIEYLSVEDSRIRGKIQPYTDPACNCMVETEFVGDLTGDYIIGTYAAQMPSLGEKHRGEWSAERVGR